MADFTALPVQNGQGPYHFNRYRVVFTKPPDAKVEDLARDFITGFPHYLNSRFASVVLHNDHTFESNPTLEFHGIVECLGVDIAKPHNDWVARIWVNPHLGFTVQTVKREFVVASEDAAAAAGGAVVGRAIGQNVGQSVGGPPGAVVGGAVGEAVGADEAVQLNRMHFLAGRRSWRLDGGPAFGLASNVCVLETIAVERFSSTFFVAGDFILHLEDKIPPIWVTNLANFVRIRQLATIPQSSPPSWDVGDPTLNINYYTYSCDTIDELKLLPEFHAAFKLYPTILPAEIAR